MRKEICALKTIRPTNKIKLLLLICLLAISIQFFSQVQIGCVETIGRPGLSGVLLENVVIRIKDLANVAKSDKNSLATTFAICCKLVCSIAEYNPLHALWQGGYYGFGMTMKAVYL